MQPLMPQPPESLLTVDGFVDQYPWPKRFRERGKPLEWLWEFDLSVAAEKLWPHLIDTSRLNRALGLAEMKFEERDGVLHGSSVNGGVVHEWVEEPWTWVNGHSLTAIRDYSRGFAHVARAIYRVVDGPTPKLAVYFGWIPRGMIGRLALRVGVPPLRKAYAKVLADLQAEIDRPRPEPYVAKPKSLEASVARRMGELRDTLIERGVDKDLIDRLYELVKTGDDMDLYRIQPRKLAHDWGVGEDSLLSACLHATRVGLLDLSWDVICPHCRGVRDESPGLSGVAGSGSCDVCEVDFTTDVENAVEVTFHIHGSIREVPKVYFCSAEPATKQHIKIQQVVEPGETLAISGHLAPGRYRARLRGNRISGFLTVREEASEQAASMLAWSSDAEIGEREVDPSIRIELSNKSESAELFVVEEVRWADEALRPSMLFALQEFRDLFSEEYLGSDVQLSVGEQTLLFTDMISSTAFYREHGDPAAFVKVKEHFGTVFAIVRDGGGAVVKTIGDAVMAVFSDPLAAVKAARGINQAFPEVVGDPDAIRLRVSLNNGPCIAVNLNTGIDYFGATVNTAAKLQACAEAGEVALSARVFSAPGVEAYLGGLGDELDHRSFEVGKDTIDYVFWRVD